MDRTQRKANFEILRILAMLMIITLHYLSKGGFLVPLTGEVTATGYLAWLIEAFCLVSVNVYILLSGYFGCRSSWNLHKLFQLWFQVFFYAFGVGGVMLLLGLTDRSAFNIYEATKLVFPIVTEHYWFATAYILLFLGMPFLNAGIEKITKKELQVVIVVLLIYNSVMKSVLPIHLPWDKLGYDVLWFVNLYLIGAYIRVYGLNLLQKKIYCLLLYLISVIGIFAAALGIRSLFIKTGSLEEFINYTYSYNHILCLMGSVGLFGLFSRLKDNFKVKTRQGIMTLSGATFGVYLLHEHLWIRYQWPVWLGVGKVSGIGSMLVHMMVSVLVVYLIGTGVELIRQRVFARILHKH